MEPSNRLAVIRSDTDDGAKRNAIVRCVTKKKIITMSRLTVVSKRGRPVGEVFTFTDGARGRQVELIVVSSRTCEGCYFSRSRLLCDVVAYDLLPCVGECIASQRADGQGVVFKEVLKD